MTATVMELAHRAAGVIMVKATKRFSKDDDGGENKRVSKQETKHE